MMGKIHTIILVILSVIVFTGFAGQKSKNSNKHQNETPFHVVKDTVLNGYHIEISRRANQLKKGKENEIQIKVDGIQSDQILLYTKVSEAKVKLGKKPNRFLILPTETAKKVDLNIHTEENGKIVRVGVVPLEMK